LHLFFADDLMPKADWCNCGSVKEVQSYFSLNVDRDRSDSLCDILGGSVLLLTWVDI